MSGREILQSKMEQAPRHPGVYLFKNARGEVIYVGKAVDLRSRLASYFARDLPLKTAQQMEMARDLEWILTANAVEALILECSLIKRHRPRYNILLKDDKRYPYIKLTMNEGYPRLIKTRLLKEDGARYFGPYASGWAVNETLDLLSRLFCLRLCKETPLKERKRPCLYYHIKRCEGPCAGKIDRASYQELAAQVHSFLAGKRSDLLRELKDKMASSSQEKHYEEAAALRDKITAIESLSEKQVMAIPFKGSIDAVALLFGNTETFAEVIEFRDGLVIGRRQYLLEETEEDSAVVLSEFLKRHYYMKASIPPEILVESLPDEKELLEEWLKEQSGRRVVLSIPERGDKRKLLEMAQRNVAENARRTRIEIRQTAATEALEELAQTLGLEEPPRSIEGFDISTGGLGRETVASCVRFENGEPKKSGYRRFKVKTVKGQTDDFASMKEILARRAAKGDLPDLFLIDGGRGQLNAAIEGLSGAGVETGAMEVISLAKKDEEIFTEYNEEPLCLSKDSPALRLLQQVRDESHRFAVTYHRLLRDKRLVTSVLDGIPGIGKEKKRALLKHFGALDKIAQASEEELSQAPGIGPKLAAIIVEALQKKEEDS